MAAGFVGVEVWASETYGRDPGAIHDAVTSAGRAVAMHYYGRMTDGRTAAEIAELHRATGAPRPPWPTPLPAGADHGRVAGRGGVAAGARGGLKLSTAAVETEWRTPLAAGADHRSVTGGGGAASRTGVRLAAAEVGDASLEL